MCVQHDLLAVCRLFFYLSINNFDHLETAYESNSPFYLDSSLIGEIKIRLIKKLLQKLSRDIK